MQTYTQYLRSQQWLQFKSKILKKNLSCVVCFSTHDLEVHHLYYSEWGTERKNQVRVLCGHCHRELHKIAGGTDYSAMRKALKQLIAEAKNLYVRTYRQRRPLYKKHNKKLLFEGKKEQYILDAALSKYRKQKKADTSGLLR